MQRGTIENHNEKPLEILEKLKEKSFRRIARNAASGTDNVSHKRDPSRSDRLQSQRTR